MPQININGELREVSQAEYDALTTNGQASTPADGSYEQYAAARAKEQAVNKLADADANFETGTNVSPEFRQELTNIRTGADAAAGGNKDAYAARYAQEQQDLYTNAPTSQQALREELSAPPPTTAPGTVGVGVPQQQGTDGQTIGTLNTTIPGLGQPAGPIVSEPVKGLTAGGLTSGTPVAGVESAPSYPTEDPQIPPPSTEGAGTFQRPPPPPDAAFRAEQAQQENRWIQAAATNPESINDRGSVVVDLGDGRRETINRDGSYEISGADGTFRYDAAGQETSYTTPTIDGFSVTTTTDGVQLTNYTNGPLTTSTITKDGEPISTTVSYDTGPARLTTIETVGGQPVGIIDVAQGGGVTERLVVDANGEVVSEEQSIQTSKQVASEAEQKAIAENQKLREDLIAAKEQTSAGIPLSDTQIAALEEQSQVTAAADAALVEAEQAVAETDPTVLAAGEDPQVDTFVDPVADPVPSLDTVEVIPENVNPAADPEVAVSEAAQTPEAVPAAEIETEAVTELTEEQTAADPEVTEPAIEEVPAAEIDTGPAPLTDEEVAEYQAQTATQVNETGANFQEPFVSDEAAAAEAAFFQENPEAVRAVIDAPPPPEIESETEELDLTLEELEERVAETEADTELTAEEEAADPEITPQDDFVLSAADIDGGDDLDQDPGPGYGDVDEPLDPDILDRANEVEVDPYEDVLGRDLTEEEIQAEDNPVDYDLEEDIDPYNAIADRDLTEEEIQAEDNPIDYSNEVEVDPYEDVLGRDLTEEEIQAEDNPIDYDLENEIDPYSDVEGRSDAEELTDEEIDAARADQQVEFGPDGLTTLSSAEAARQRSTLDRARAQAILQQQRKQANDGDWRVRLRLAPLAEYLYKSDNPGILQPLAVTDGVVFPYTPQITTAYKATYNSYNLTHSNYRGFFYQGSQVEDIQINATFTAQDTAEANYLLAVIHFFRSVTKMFYGQDATSGAPPPLVFLQGLGEYQFNLAPCVVASFNYVLPADVDYIRAGSPNINGTNLLQRRDRQDLPTNPFSSAWTRINNVLKPQGIKKGAIASPPAPPTLGTNRPTYVPTKMEISIILHPMQSREQVSKQFSLKQYANGDLLKGGFW
jgi:hypothetical protein